MAACTLHSIVGCAQCAGTMTAEDHWYLHLGAVAGTGTVAEGTVRKRYTVPPRDYLRPLYNQQWRAQRTPAPQAQPFGHGTEGTRPTEPKLNQPLTTARVRRAGEPARYTTHRRATHGTATAPYGATPPAPPAPTGLEAAQIANRKLAAELGINLPD